MKPSLRFELSSALPLTPELPLPCHRPYYSPCNAFPRVAELRAADKETLGEIHTTRRSTKQALEPFLEKSALGFKWTRVFDD